MELPGGFGPSVQMCVNVCVCESEREGFGSSLVLSCRVSLLHFLPPCSVGCHWAWRRGSACMCTSVCACVLVGMGDATHGQL